MAFNNLILFQNVASNVNNSIQLIRLFFSKDRRSVIYNWGMNTQSRLLLLIRDVKLIAKQTVTFNNHRFGREIHLILTKKLINLVKFIFMVVNKITLTRTILQ